MNIQIDTHESDLIKLASHEADAWHFNKYLALIIISAGLITVTGKTIYEFLTTGNIVISIANVVISMAMFTVAILWLRQNWAKTNKEKAIEIIYSKIRESA
jgi:RsiW-degrading membrane proteinase PrsW (M82 family)